MKRRLAVERAGLVKRYRNPSVRKGKMFSETRSIYGRCSVLLCLQPTILAFICKYFRIEPIGYIWTVCSTTIEPSDHKYGANKYYSI